MSGAVASGEEGMLIVFLKEIKISAHNVFGLEEHKAVWKRKQHLF
jgi:hypothetical protein